MRESPHAIQDAVHVLIVDDQAIVRKGTCALLAEVDSIEVVGEAADGREAVAQANKLRPDVILMDLVMPVMDGIEATRRICEGESGARILALTSFAADDKVFPAIKAGALGYLLKDAEPEQLVEAIFQTYRGEPSMHPTIARKVLQEIRHPANKPPTPDPLTTREIEVLKLLAHGEGNAEIADLLAISEVTVRTHVSNILGKLHLANRVQATLYALREGLTSLENGADDPEI
jgi:NarL family two-component system response regulator LiaR